VLCISVMRSESSKEDDLELLNQQECYNKENHATLGKFVYYFNVKLI